MKRRRIGASAILLIALASVAGDQQPGPGGPPGPQQPPGPDPLAGNLFPPELIMQNQQALGLSDEQRTYLLGEIQRTQGQATAVQWRLQAAVEKLAGIVRQERIDETQVLAQLDSVLALEREMKRLQITLLVRLKNRLAPEQQALLRGRLAPHQ